MEDRDGVRRAALITGAASGLGSSFAEILARDGCDVVVVDRQAERVKARADHLAERYGVRSLAIVQDLTAPDAVRRVRAQCDEHGFEIGVLVNNAGFHLNKFVHELPWATIAQNIRLFLEVVLEMTHEFLPGMIERRWGRIVNVSSVSGFMPGGLRLATYTSTKAFLIPFSEALNFELEGTGVNVSALCPGFIKTELFVNSGLTDVRDSVPSFMWLEPERVAEEGVRAVMKRVPVHISGLPNRLIVVASKVVPRALLRERSRILHRSAHGKVASAKADRGGSADGNPLALVTGASAGIGASFAKQLAKQGHDVILVARRKDLLEERAQDLAKRYGVRTHVIVQDMTDANAVENIVGRCEGRRVDVLVNNAGYPMTELFHQMKWSSVTAALQILVKSVVHLSHAFLPEMVARGAGTIINVASMAGFEPGSYRSSLYSSSKAFVIAFSESVHCELEGTGVTMTAVCPGFTKTEWTTKNQLKNSSVPKIFWMESDRVVEEGLAAAQRGAPVSVVGTPALRMVSTLFQVGPRAVVGRFLSSKRRGMAV
jgi:short-subunit dehydrogenase